MSRTSTRINGIAGLAVAAMGLAPAGAANAGENPAEALELPTVNVIGTTPLPGLGVPLRDVPANVQVYTSRELGRERLPSVSDFLERSATGVTAHAAQGNPFQPDVTFRGFTASPLLGLPQGLSVFQDGVRINEPFGDVVNWDLVPQSAISSMQLLPGSNPAFGLNTLGGALAVYTKSGTDYPGGAVQAYGGSFGRRALEVEQGGRHGAWDYFVTGNLFDDNGWAEHNPSRVRQLFGKVGYQTANTDLDLSLTAADNTLQGTQTLPLSFFDNVRQAYTFPDINENRVSLVTLKGSRFLGDDVLLGGNVYHRKYKNSNVSSNVNDNFGEIDPITGAIDENQATNDRSHIDQESYGAGLQLTFTRRLLGHANQLAFGASADYGRARFSQESQPAVFTSARDTVGVGEFELSTDADTTNRYYGVFATDTFSIDEQWSVTVSGRYNWARVTIADRTGTSPELDGEHEYRRFNPAIGITYNPKPGFTAFASYSEGMRAPTPIELTCADPQAPCKLPNNFLADPPLEKVVARTFEIGARGSAAAGTTWSAAIYRSELQDDIQFISSGSASVNAGFFQNVGSTRRQGVELGVATTWRPLAVSARYSFLDATYRTGFTESSPHNSSADANGNIEVRPGDAIPASPRHTFKLRLDYEPVEAFALGVSLVANSSTYARGDENNRDAGGKVPGYGVVNLDARYTLARGLDLFARVDNLFDRRYATFGVLGQNFFTGPGHTFDPEDAVNEQFRGLGAPRGAWAGVRYSWL